MKRILLLLLIISGLGLSLSAQTKYPPVEKLAYFGYYNWGLLWIKAGYVEFTLSQSEKYPNADKLKAIGGTLPSWDWVFKVRDTLSSHYDRDTYLPHEFSRLAYEGNYHKMFRYKFDYQDSVIFADIHRIGKYHHKDTVRLKPKTFDMLSVAWMARELDFDKYKKNDQIPVRMLIDCKIYDLYVRYLGVHTTKIAGDKRECYVFCPLLLEGDIFKGGEDMKVWVSKDEYRLPLMVEANILVGSVKAIIDPDASRVYDLNKTNN